MSPIEVPLPSARITDKFWYPLHAETVHFNTRPLPLLQTRLSVMAMVEYIPILYLTIAVLLSIIPSEVDGRVVDVSGKQI